MSFIHITLPMDLYLITYRHRTKKYINTVSSYVKFLHVSMLES